MAPPGSSSGRGLAVAILLLLAAPAGAVEIRLFARTAPQPLTGPGCGTVDTVAAPLARGAFGVGPFTGSAVGDPVPGPDGASLEDGSADPEYAMVQDLVATETEAVWTVAASDRHCAAGWRTLPWQFAARYRVRRPRLYTLDPQGNVRRRVPRRLSISRRWEDLEARRLVWTRWGRQVAKAVGRVHWDGASHLVRIEAYNPEWAGAPDAVTDCPGGRIYYENLAVEIPAWGIDTSFRINRACTRSIVNNSAGDVGPPRATP